MFSSSLRPQVVLLALATLLSTASAVAAPAQTTKAAPNPPKKLPLPNLRVLALGDGFTTGYSQTPPNAYRRYLQCFLHLDGTPMTYIGKNNDGDWPNNAHEAFAYHDNGVAMTVAETHNLAMPLLQTFGDTADKPNVVILMAGSQDLVLDPKIAPSLVADALGDFIADIDKYTSATILVGKIPYLGGNHEDLNTKIDTYNMAVQLVVDHNVANGVPIVLVDMTWVVLGGQLDASGVYPTAEGYRAMANAWKDQLQIMQIKDVEGPFQDLASTALSAAGNCDLSA